MGACTKLTLVGVVIVACFVGLKVRDLQNDAPAPVMAKDVWWGQGSRRPLDDTIRQFKIDVPNQVITDLKARLSAFLIKPSTPPLEGIGFQYGFNSDYLRTVVKYWRDQYDWKAREKMFNGLPQYTTIVNGLKLHYIRVTPAASLGKRVLPLLLLHGWPGSIREFYEIIPLLTQPNTESDFAFEVVVPSLPGYGFSEAPARPGMGPLEMAVVINNLMTKIGFQKYYVQGGDWGALLAKNLAALYPRTVLGLHSNMCSVSTGYGHLLTFLGSFYPGLIVDKEHEHLIYPFTEKFFRILEETGYFHLQATKPDTIGTALADSPAGLAAYIIEKFSTWTNNSFKTLPDGGLTKKFTLDQLLDNVMIYWVTNSITTSQRLYSEAFTFKQMAHRMDDVAVTIPSACARFHNELLWQPEALIKLKYKDIVQLTDYEDGGHFAAFELPQVMAKDIISAIDKMERRKTTKK